MKQQKMIAKQIQKGVKFYYKEVPDLYHDKKTAYDIDVDDNVKELIIPTDLKMNNTKKSFPSVKKLIIDALVVDIQIPNSLFPNVKQVVSKSKYFDTCFEYSSVLMRNTFGFWTLLNTFCKEEGEEIDLQDVIAINDFAFQGCKSTRIKSPDMSKYVCAVTVAPNAFTGSAFENAPFVDGVKMAGNIVIGIDNSADTVVIPDSDNQNVTFASNVVCNGIKKIIVHSPDTVSQLGYTCGFPETLVLKTDLLLKEEDVAAKAHEHINDNYIKHFSIVNPGYKEIDGIVYTNNEEKLVACSMEKEHVVVPDGVKTIGSSAFANCMIKSVIIPDSVTEIRGEAFKQCQNLESVIFGKNVKIIGREAFSQCYNIKHLSMPEGLRAIRNDAFAYSGLESIKLNEGLKKIGANVFFCTNIKSIRLPETIKCIEDKCLSGSIENVYIPIFLKGILDICAAGTYHPDTNDDKITRLQCGERYLYMPQHLNSLTYAKASNQIQAFFLGNLKSRPEMWSYANTAICRENLALLEYFHFRAEGAKEYIKKFSKGILSRFIQEGDEKQAVEFVKTGFVSQNTLKEMMLRAKENNMVSLQAYILEQLKNKPSHFCDFSRELDDSAF